MKKLNDELEKFYNNFGLLDLPPMFSCSNRDSCWNDVEDNRKINCDWGLYYPFSR